MYSIFTIYQEWGYFETLCPLNKSINLFRNTPRLTFNNIGQIVSVPTDVNFFDSFHSVTMKWEVDKIEYFLDTQSEPYFSISKASRSEFNTDY